jgi:DnaK suppressor protein
MAMNIDHFKQLLLDKESELTSDIQRLQKEARESDEAEVRDFSDEATASQNTSELLQEDGLRSQTLEQVRDALQRIDDGTYGKCLACGRPIEPARLEAVPWAQYCLEDQEKFDQAAQVPQGGATL